MDNNWNDALTCMRNETMTISISRRNALLTGFGLPAALAASLQQSEVANVQKPKRFEEIAGFEAADITTKCPFALLPLGSLEFHGPHHPLGADSIIISGIAEEVAIRTNALLFPTIKFTQCPAHGAFSGNAVNQS